MNVGDRILTEIKRRAEKLARESLVEGMPLKVEMPKLTVYLVGGGELTSRAFITHDPRSGFLEVGREGGGTVFVVTEQIAALVPLWP